MRIIGGSARGRRLKAPKGRALRPTAARVKEALFNILPHDLSGVKVLDLFAGTGLSHLCQAKVFHPHDAPAHTTLADARQHTIGVSYL